MTHRYGEGDKHQQTKRGEGVALTPLTLLCFCDPALNRVGDSTCRRFNRLLAFIRRGLGRIPDLCPLDDSYGLHDGGRIDAGSVGRLAGDCFDLPAFAEQI